MITAQKFDREKFVSIVAAMICSDDHLAVEYIGRRKGNRHSSAVDRVAAIVSGVLDGIPQDVEDEECQSFCSSTRR